MSVPKPAEQSINLVLASIVLAAGAVLLFSFVLHLGMGSDVGFMFSLITLPGRFLFLSFHYAGLFVPLYLSIAAGLLLLNRVRMKTVFALHLALLPFLTSALGLRLLLDPNAQASAAPRVVANALTPLGGAITSLLATVVLVVLILRFVRSPVAMDGRKDTDGIEKTDETEATDEAEPREAIYKTDEADETDETAAMDELADFDDGHQPLQVGTALLGPRIAELLRNQVTPPTTTEPLVEEPAEIEVEDEFVEELDEIEDDIEDDIEDEDEDDEELPEEIHPTDESSPVFVFRRHESEVGRRFTVVQDAIGDELSVDVDVEPEPIEELEPEQQPMNAMHVREEKKPDPRSGSRRPAARAKRVPYNVPVDGLLEHYSDDGYWVIDDETRKAAELLRVTLEEFQIQAEVTGIRKGPVITMFELLPAPGVKLAKITNLADNIALRLAASSVRIVAPIPGKHAVGIEIPNKKRNIVSFGELLREENFTESDMAIPLAIGKDIPGDAQIIDLARTPHLLIAGATGSGKSVCVNSIICSVLYRRAPHEVKLILIDPKIVELKFYNDIPHLLTPVITDPKRAFQALQWCIYEMERRYALLDSLGVRDIRSFNAKVRKREIATEKLPYIVVVVDEFADLMATSGKELESTLARLAAMSRAVGIHLVLATQRPSTDVITGLIKANIPSRIAFMVASKVDSRIIIDSVGAEKLLGKGDMLFTSAWDPFPFRIQGAFLSEDEVERVVEHVKTLGEPEYIDDEIFIEEDEDDVYHDELEDPLLEKAINIVVGANKASASYLQRRLKIGYNRAARLVEEMERLGIVGPQNGSKARDILHVPEQVG